jgi:hypothetical protein
MKMPIKEVMTAQREPVKIWTNEVDVELREQLKNIVSLSFIHHHVAVCITALAQPLVRYCHTQSIVRLRLASIAIAI